MVESKTEKELKTKAPETWEYMQFLKQFIDIFENFEVVQAGDNFIIVFDFVKSATSNLEVRYPMEMQLAFSEGTKPFWAKKNLKFSGLLYLPQIKKFGCYILDDDSDSATF